MTTSADHSRRPPETGPLLLRRVSGDEAGAARELLASSLDPLPAPGADPSDAVYALVDLASPVGELVGVALVTTDVDGGRHLALAVSPTHRGRGVGSRLLGDVLDVLRSEGVARVDADVGGCPVAARLCERTGFRPVDGVAGRLALDL